MATKRKFKRYDEGGITEGENANIDDSTRSRAMALVEAGMMEKEPEENFKSTPKAKAPVVTKEQLAKSGLSLRDYMNKQQGLTRRGAAKDEMSSVASDRAAAYKKADAQAKSPEGRAERQKQIEGQAVERVTPEANLLPVGSLKTLAAVAKGMAGRHAAKGAEKFAEYSTPVLEMAKRRIGTEPLKLGMKKGGAVKSAPKSSSASRRADGMASKGKTKGRMV